MSWRLLPIVNIRIRGGSIIFYIVVPIQEISTERTTDNGSPSGTPQVLLEGRLMQLLKKSTRFILCRKSTHCTANVRGIPNLSIISGMAILGIVLKNFVRSVTTPVRVIGFLQQIQLELKSIPNITRIFTRDRTCNRIWKMFGSNPQSFLDTAFDNIRYIKRKW